MYPQMDANGVIFSSKIEEYMSSLLKQYDGIRGVCPESVGVPFWDLVVISCSADQAQTDAYQTQLNAKRERKELPVVPMWVIPDPPGPKVESGGATLHVIEKLYNKYGSKMDNMKIYVIQAGGDSKRLPNHSTVGKIFTPLPLGPPMCQMLDMKLTTYLPLIPHLPPGIFVTCSDDVVAFYIDDESALDLSDLKGFIVLAHPSSLQLGSTHGVYVLPAECQKRSEYVFVTDCLEVLQKPSVDHMRECGAVIKTDDDREIVYSDSVFWFDSSTGRALLDLYHAIKPLKDELNAYRDFIPCMGTRANKRYEKVVLGKEAHGSIYRLCYEVLRSLPLHVLVLNESKFYHMGTLREYVDNLAVGATFTREMRFKKNVQVKVLGKRSDRINGTVMQSVICGASTVHLTSVVEYCCLESPVDVQESCVLSNCHLREGRAPVVIPKNMMFHTVPIRHERQPLFVTVAFNIDDDIKASKNKSKAGDLMYCGVPLSQAARMWNVKDASTFFKTESCSLWVAKLFLSASTMSESFLFTVDMIYALEGTETQSEPTHRESADGLRFSMADIVQVRDIPRLLESRRNMCGEFSS